MTIWEPLQDVTRRMGQAAAAFEAGFLAGLVSANPVMSDSKALFCLAHGNLATAGSIITVDSLAAARKAMCLQTGLLGEQISVSPKYLLVGADGKPRRKRRSRPLRR